MSLWWPAGEPRTRIMSKGGLLEYCIVRVQSKPEPLYRWARSKRPWSTTVYPTLGSAKAACLSDYKREIYAAAQRLRMQDNDNPETLTNGLS